MIASDNTAFSKKNWLPTHPIPALDCHDKIITVYANAFFCKGIALVIVVAFTFDGLNWCAQTWFCTT